MVLTNNESRINSIDALKGIAILAVIFFHCGLFATGYLGVDIFLAVSGYFTIPYLCKSIVGNNFSALSFLRKRLVRLLPLTIIASAICLAFGYFVMLPDAYENLAESAVASNLMAENILESIISQSYWDISNDYKPLMHLWYIGILFQFYIVAAVALLATRFIAKVLRIDTLRATIFTIIALALISICLYFSIDWYAADRYYLPQYRLFEFIIGGIFGLTPKRFNLRGVPFILLVVALCSGFIPAWALLLLIVALSSLTILDKTDNSIIYNPIFIYLGKRSFSIFVWHQILLAFYRYTVTADIHSFKFILPYIAITLLLSELTYRGVEQGIKPTVKNTLIAVVCSLLVTSTAFYIYNHAGVVRDVPELDIVKGEEHRQMFREYCDRIYGFDRDFPDNGKINILVTGVSFGRDFANVLLESDIADDINISYLIAWDENDTIKEIKRIKESDYIFSFCSKSDIPKFVFDNLNANTHLYGIGTKRYGESNGPIYAHRNSPDYFSQTAILSPEEAAANANLKKEWGEDNYVDLIGCAMVDSTHIRVFTPDNKYISQDCRHLTEAGAKWYARIIDLRKFIKI